MAEEYIPRPLTRKELAEFLPNMRSIRAFEQLFDNAYRLSDIQRFLTVTNIDNPSELNTIEGGQDGYLCVAVQGNEFTLYVYTSERFTENIPYTINGLSGSWTAIAGKYVSSESNIEEINTDVITSALGYIDNLESDEVKAAILEAIQVKTSYIDLDLTYTNGHQEGRIHWNADDGVPEVGMPGGNVIQQIGLELLARVTNKTGSLIPNGTPVYVNGVQGNRPTIDLAKADAEMTSVTFLGLTTEDIINNNNGYVCLTGYVRDIDTSAFSAGDVLYISSTVAGGLTSTRPTAPNWKIGIGICLNDHATEGIIGVLPRMWPSLNRLQDVYLSSLIDRNLMVYNLANQRWENTTAWKDIQFSLTTAKLPAVNAPAWTAFTTALYKFTYAIGDYSYLAANEISHSYLQESDFTFHCHIYTNGVDGTDRIIAFELIYAITNKNGIASETTVISPDFTIPANTPDRTHFYVPIVTVTGTGFLIGADIALRFRRVAASAGTAPTNDPFVSMVGMHIEQDFHGSRNETSK